MTDTTDKQASSALRQTMNRSAAVANHTRSAIVRAAAAIGEKMP